RTPCCKCEACIAVAEGEDVDVVEIDAASNTGVDNIRELRSNAAFRPARARFKIYIIDEVHMLSTGAFNALLKTLEEPPEHVKFILATTEPQKVPATIKSRCQNFDFHAIGTGAIADHLQMILDAQKIQADKGVLGRVARLAGGSMRDALSLLDKLLSYEADHLTTEIADMVIPPPHDELAFAVMECVAKNDAAGALMALDAALQSGRTVERFCDHLIEHVRTLMLLRVCGEKTDLADVSDQMRPAMVAQATAFDGPTYVYMITLLEELRRSVKTSGSARALADAAIVRLAMSRQFSDIGELIQRLQGGDEALSMSAAADAKEATRGPKVAAPQRAQRVPDKPPKTSGSPGASGGSPPTAPPAAERRSVSSTEWRKTASDPAVQRVKAAVDGTLFDVRPVAKPSEVPSGEEAPTGETVEPDA
ncbi:MAG: DNA polymerase III subunit gamma/tau, partial [Planctomycetes bacterium]|nr:DNA polymerase III subunit gamma/tau [Planctomycetota bacterium]